MRRDGGGTPTGRPAVQLRGGDLRAWPVPDDTKSGQRTTMTDEITMSDVDEVKELPVDSRGRVTVGSDYAGGTVTVAVRQETDSGDEQTDENDGERGAIEA